MQTKTKTKRKQWVRPRHTLIRNLAFLVLAPWSRLKYGIRVKKLGEKKERQYLIIMNHQTAFDQFFVGMAFKRPVYYLASEDLFSLGFLSTLLKWAVAPIPIKKQTTDVQAVMNCLRVAKEGGNDHVSGLGGGDGGADGFGVPHLSQQDHIRCLPQAGSQG